MSTKPRSPLGTRMLRPPPSWHKEPSSSPGHERSDSKLYQKCSHVAVSPPPQGQEQNTRESEACGLIAPVTAAETEGIWEPWLEVRGG